MLKEFVIDRSRWLRGTGAGTLLHEDNGMQCCIGHYLTACGVPDDTLLGSGQPEEVATSIPSEATWLIRPAVIENGWSDSSATAQLIDVNDDPKVEDKEREHHVASVFEEHGIRVTFVDALPSEGAGDDK